MLFKNITILDENLDMKENQFVLVTDDKISYIGDVEPKSGYSYTYSGKNKLLMTGFINSHSHTPMTLMRGYAENLQLENWLNDKIFPFEAKLTKEQIEYGTKLGIAEMLRFGIVSTSDMYYFSDTMAEVFLQSGMKCNLSRGIVCFSDDDYINLPAYKENLSLIKNYHNSGFGRLKIDLSVHAEYTNTDKSVIGVSEHAKENGLIIQVHLSETKKEHEECAIRRNGKTPAEYFNSLGMFENKTVCAHSIWLSENDLNILMEKNVSVASCPKSNLKLASGICDVKALLEKGINVGVGTDSVASNNNLNMLEEIKFFALLNKAKHLDPTIITPKQALYAATKAGAIIQDRLDCGALKVGNKADLIVLDIDKPYMKPIHNLLNNLVYSAVGTDIILTMVDGKILYKDGEYKTIDIEKLNYVQELAMRNV